MRMLILLILFFMTLTPLCASTITAHMELVLSRDGTLVDGPTTLTISLLGPENAIRWTETLENVQFSKGVTSFEIGRGSEIKTHYFYDQGIQLTIAINDDTISLPMHSTPFSLFSHAADVVNAIHMDGVFHTDLVNKRIGINIDIPTPSVRFEVNGAIRLGDDPDIDEIGSIRWRDHRLEGRHNHSWKKLDVSPADGFESKWDFNQSDLTPAFYVLGSSVLIGSTTPQGALTVAGALNVDQQFRSGGQLLSTGRLNLIGDYGVSHNASVVVRSVTLNATNVFNFTDGLKVSGILTGKGHGVSNLQSVNLRDNAIQNNELADFSVSDAHIRDDAVTNPAIQLASISREKLNASFELSNDYFLSQIVTDNKVKRGSVHENDLSPSFELMAFHFQDASVVSRNIGAGEIDSVKIQDNGLVLADFSTAFIDHHTLLVDQLISSPHIKANDIQAEDFAPGSLSYSHFSSLVPINKGGTDQSAYGGVGELIVVSGNQFISDSTYVLNGTGLGVNTNNPLVRLDIHQANGWTPLQIRSNQDSSTGMVIKNDIGHWFFGLSATDNVEIMDRLNNRRMLSMNNLGHIGIKTEPSTELMRVNGGVILGDKQAADGLSLKEGTMYFSESDKQFKLRTSLGISLLDLGPVGPHQIIPSSLYVHHVTNASEGSRVLLGKKSYVSGKDHLISGASDSVIDGEDHMADFMHSSVLSGAFSTAQFLNNSQLIGRQILGRFLNDSTVVGDHHSIQFSRDSSIHGAGSHASFATDSALLGNDHRLSFSESVQFFGDNHVGEHVRDVRLDGQLHRVMFSSGMDANGRGHWMDHSHHASVLGESHSLLRSQLSTVTGRQNTLEGTNRAVVSGTNNHLIHGGGMVVGNDNRHYGSGSPLIIGQKNAIMGAFSGDIQSNSIISMGTSSASVTTDHSIHFYAPGGVDIVSGEIALAHLSPNAGSWSHVSDRSVKMNVQPLDANAILSKVIDLPIMEWNYKGQHYVQHIGPMAQDFYASFGLGSTNRYIQSVDVDGVIFSSIQALGRMMNQLSLDATQLDQKERVMMSGLAVASTNLDALKVSGNQLVQMNNALNLRFESMYQKEVDQVKEIKALNKKVAAIRALREGIQ
tara:strand:- start:1272 stop:4589 length:3318 start_codon:yes stop_codon:yes gene_type:complete